MTATIPRFPMDVEFVYDALRHLTVGRVTNFLVYTFDSGDHEILDLARERDKWVTTPTEYASSHGGAMLAAHVSIIFWGGPPDDGMWHTGTLLAMLVDRLFYNFAVGNFELIERFMRMVEHD